MVVFFTGVIESVHPAAAGSSPAEGRPKRLPISRGGTFLIGIAIALAAIVSTRLAPHAAGPDRELDPDEPPGGGIVVRSELIHVWLPETLAELAQGQARSQVVRDHGGVEATPRASGPAGRPGTSLTFRQRIRSTGVSPRSR